MKIQFIKSSVFRQDDPIHDFPEIAIVGRSNAGKSSFLNAISPGKKVAKVSKTPGKTRLLNFFQAGEQYCLVDMPGYGFASRGFEERDDWRDMVESYLLERKNLVGLLMIMDIRRSWTEEEQLLVNWCQTRGAPICLALSKIDKLGYSNQVKSKRSIQQASSLENIFLISSLKKTGVEDLEQFIFRNWIKKFKE